MPAALDVDWSAIKVAFIAGATLEEIARSFGISENTLYTRSARENWVSLRPENRRKLLKAGERPSSEMVADIWAQRQAEHREGWQNITSKQRARLERMDEDEVAKSLDVVKTMFDIERKNLGLDKESGNVVNVAIGVLNDDFDTSESLAIETEAEFVE